MASASVVIGVPLTTQTSKSKRLNQYIGALVASLGGFSLGVSLAWNSRAGDILRDILEATGTEIGLIGAVVNAGACLGVLSVPGILRFFSRTGAMFLSIPVNMIGWACICFADQQVWLLVSGRTICGIVGGMFCVLTPLYIAEIAERNIRSRLLTFFQLCINFGVLYAFIVAHGLDERDTIWRYSLICAVACAPIALVNFLPESPLYHAKMGNTNAARRSIGWYRGDDYEYREKELEEFEKLATMEKWKGCRATMKMLKNRRVSWSLVVAHGIMIAQQLSGVNTMIFYALVIFDNGVSGTMSGEEQTLVVGGVQILSCLLCAFCIDRIGRRVLLTLSAAFTGLFLVLLGWYFSVRDDDPELYDESYGWMPPTWMSLFFAAFNVGVGPISWSILADTFPMELRLAGAISAAFLSWLLSLIATLTFGEMATALGIPKTMWLFGAFSWITAIFGALFVRDSAKKSLLDIQMDFCTNHGDSTSESGPVEQT